jgi:hypothetical protein
MFVHDARVFEEGWEGEYAGRHHLPPRLARDKFVAMHTACAPWWRSNAPPSAAYSTLNKLGLDHDLGAQG